MKTIERINKKIKHEGSHWIWLGYTPKRCNSPTVGLSKDENFPDRYREKIAVRKYLWFVKNGKLPKVCYITCKNNLCVNPEHATTKFSKLGIKSKNKRRSS